MLFNLSDLLTTSDSLSTLEIPFTKQEIGTANLLAQMALTMNLSKIVVLS